MKVAILCVAVLAAVNYASAKDCVWDREDDFGKYPPLLLDLDTKLSILPTLDGTNKVVRLGKGEYFVLSCPESTNGATNEEEVTAKCTGRLNRIKIGKKTYTMKEASCSSKVKNMVSDVPRPCQLCKENQQNDYYSIGFNTTANEGFDDMIQFRFNEDTDTPLYTVHLLRGEHVAAADTSKRPSFKTDSDFFHQSPNYYYSQCTQKLLMMKLFGNFDYINVAKSNYFARGHLSPDGDFLSAIEADATYFYTNCVPQMQSFNNGNWKELEIATRKLAEAHKTDFQIWTGIYGLLTLPDKDGNEKEIYLGLIDDLKIIPAPKLMWKVIYEPSTEKAVAVIGSNNPYIKEFPTPLCDNICDEIDWITFDTTNLGKGATYCCSVQDFVDKMMPQLSEEGFAKAGILKN